MYKTLKFISLKVSLMAGFHFTPVVRMRGRWNHTQRWLPSRRPQPLLLARTILAACTANILGIELDPGTTRDPGSWAAIFSLRVAGKAGRECSHEGESMSAGLVR